MKTNEEKASEIALKYAREYLVSRNDSHKQNILFKESSIIECEKASLETAQWKNEQLEAEKQALIDKACEWLSKNIESDKYLSPDEESYRMGCGVDYLETNMFIEDFKNYMKGGEE